MIFPHFNFADVSTSVGSDSETQECMCVSLSSLKQLHHLEADSTIKYAYKLSAKALSPSNLERQNVKLVIQIFNEHVSHALHQLGQKFSFPHWENTAAFIKLIVTWWDIVNVSTPNKGNRLKNEFKKPIICEETEAKKFLKQFLDWLRKWEMAQTAGKLTKETFIALKHTTQALLEISDFVSINLEQDMCCWENFKQIHLKRDSDNTDSWLEESMMYHYVKFLNAKRNYVCYPF